MANLTEEVVRRGVTAPLGLRPTPRWSRIYRSRGVWRDQTPVSDLRRWRRMTPDASHSATAAVTSATGRPVMVAMVSGESRASRSSSSRISRTR